MPYKVPTVELVQGESRLVNFRHAGNLEEDEILETVTELDCTPDPASTNPDLVVGTPVAEGTEVQVRVSGGQRGKTYRFAGFVETSFGNTLALEGDVVII